MSVELAPRLLRRAAIEVITDTATAHLTNSSIRLHLSQSVKAIAAQDGMVCGAQLGDKVLAADQMPVGIGAIPTDDLAQEAGLSICDNNILMWARSIAAERDLEGMLI